MVLVCSSCRLIRIEIELCFCNSNMTLRRAIDRCNVTSLTYKADVSSTTGHCVDEQWRPQFVSPVMCVVWTNQVNKTSICDT